MVVVYYNLRLSKFFARSVRLGACGLTPDYIMDSGCAEPETLGNGASLQALHLVEVQDPFDCLLI